MSGRVGLGVWVLASGERPPRCRRRRPKRSPPSTRAPRAQAGALVGQNYRVSPRNKKTPRSPALTLGRVFSYCNVTFPRRVYETGGESATRSKPGWNYLGNSFIHETLCCESLSRRKIYASQDAVLEPEFRDLGLRQQGPVSRASFSWKNESRIRKPKARSRSPEPIRKVRRRLTSRAPVVEVALKMDA